MSLTPKPLWYRWARVYFAGACIIGTGVLLFKYNTPTDEELIARFSPQVRAEYEKSRELRQLEQQELMKIVQKTAASNDPIWKTGPIGSPFEKDQRNLSQKLVDEQLFANNKRDLEILDSLTKAQLELEETEKLIENKKSSWKFW